MDRRTKWIAGGRARAGRRRRRYGRRHRHRRGGYGPALTALDAGRGSRGGAPVHRGRNGDARPRRATTAPPTGSRCVWTTGAWWRSGSTPTSRSSVTRPTTTGRTARTARTTTDPVRSGRRRMSCTGMVGSTGGAIGRFGPGRLVLGARWRSWPRRARATATRPRRRARARSGSAFGNAYRLERRDGHDDPAADRAGAASPSPPRARRVDLAMPTFSDPTNITNPLFPVSSQDSVLMLGHVDGKPFRTEVTLLPETQIIEWEGRRVENAGVSTVQRVPGRSASRRSRTTTTRRRTTAPVCFGRTSLDFIDGAIVVTEGTWRAGRDGPAAMIMPGDPQVGDVYRTENAPGFVFEEVTVRSVAPDPAGPAGPDQGAGSSPSELHMRRRRPSRRSLAPGSGVSSAHRGRGDVEALALAVPTDALDGAVPAELTDPVGRRARDLRRGRVRTGAGSLLATIRAAHGGRLADLPRRRTCPR